MKLLVTSAIKLSNEQIAQLSKKNELIFVENEKAISLDAIELEAIEGIVCNFFFVNNSLDIFPNLRFVQLTSVGTERVSVKELQRRNIRFYNIRTAYAIPMAEFALAELLNIYKNARFFISNQERKHWVKNREILEIAGKKALILGYGTVGRSIAQRLKAFDVEVIGMSRSKKYDEYCDGFITKESLDDIIPEIDIFILCLPKTDATYHIIDDKRLERMKDTATIINVARGSLIDEKRLIDLIDGGKFLGVALDVFEEEPLSESSKLWEYDNVYITPHNSFVSETINQRIFEELMENLEEE
ncbi:4-phosphoerythronate dehydrogenase [Pseudobutyrivibrio ruminis]|uniref:4-phosphoerythronate dehydrogenase n=1 Tax=Pseudobutyrivibrio ruminis TaxID=46206 RepID=A0A2G3EB63_9FIRM|nr:D-2-hydroxyacid dehydrogenase [Pseudobutyrivibrio ruminis]PHU40395.1 4-phosphoerythronate dehydrogenase [Pseudobutyrivibrio ruminis]